MNRLICANYSIRSKTVAYTYACSMYPGCPTEPLDLASSEERVSFRTQTPSFFHVPVTYLIIFAINTF